jgi:hypothetical protein
LKWRPREETTDYVALGNGNTNLKVFGHVYMTQDMEK